MSGVSGSDGWVSEKTQIRVSRLVVNIPWTGSSLKEVLFSYQF